MAPLNRRKTTDIIKIIANSEKNRAYAFSIFTIIVLIVLIIGAIKPTVDTILRISDDLDKKERINIQLETKISSLTALTQQYGTISTEAEGLPLVFPTQGNFSLFMSNIEDIATEHGYTLTSISFSKSDDIDLNLNVLENWSATISIVGKRTNIIEALDAFESMPMYPVVTSFSHSNKTDENGLTSFSIGLTIFHLDDNNFFEKQ